MHTIQIDRSKTLAAEPHLGHNRFHPEVSPVLEVSPGEEIAIDTRDAFDTCWKRARLACLQ
jgi:formamidase